MIIFKQSKGTVPLLTNHREFDSMSVAFECNGIQIQFTFNSMSLVRLWKISEFYIKSVRDILTKRTVNFYLYFTRAFTTSTLIRRRFFFFIISFIRDLLTSGHIDKRIECDNRIVSSASLDIHFCFLFCFLRTTPPTLTLKSSKLTQLWNTRYLLEYYLEIEFTFRHIHNRYWVSRIIIRPALYTSCYMYNI